MTTFQKLMRYLVNCFLLLIPVLLWNLVFMPFLPATITNPEKWSDFPKVLLWLEGITRIIVFVMPAFMPLRIKTPGQKAGLVLYVLGLIIYLFAWREFILFPHGTWATSLIGFTSLAYTPFIIFMAIALIGRRMYVKFPYHRLVFALSALAYTVLHTWHTVLVYMTI